MKFLKVFITFLLVCSFVFSSGALAVEASETNVVNLVDILTASPVHGGFPMHRLCKLYLREAMRIQPI